MHPLFQVLDAKTVYVPSAAEAEARMIRHYVAKGRAIKTRRLPDGSYLVTPAELEPLRFVTDPTTTWDRVRTE